MSNRWQGHIDEVLRVEAGPVPPLQPPPRATAATGGRWVPWTIGAGAVVVAGLLAAASPERSGIVAGVATGALLGAVGLAVWAYVRHTNAKIGAIDPATGGPTAVAYSGRTVPVPKGGAMHFVDVVLRDGGPGFLVASTDDHAAELRGGGSTWAWAAGSRRPGGALVIALPGGQVLRCRRVAAA